MESSRESGKGKGTVTNILRFIACVCLVLALIAAIQPSNILGADWDVWLIGGLLAYMLGPFTA